jgi:hypothetical protein
METPEAVPNPYPGCIQTVSLVIQGVSRTVPRSYPICIRTVPSRADWKQLIGMTGHKQSTEHILERLEASGRRSTLFRWFKTNYVRVLRISLAAPIEWDALAADLAAAGITDSAGRPPTPNTVKTTWHRVKRIMRNAPPAVEVSDPMSKSGPVPARPAQGWQPPIVNQALPPRVPVAPTPPTVTDEAPSKPRRTVADMTPQESMDEALREMDQRANRRAGFG